MLAAATEQTRRLDLKVTNLLLVAIDDAKALFLLDFLVFLLDLLFLFLCHRFALLALL